MDECIRRRDLWNSFATPPRKKCSSDGSVIYIHYVHLVSQKPQCNIKSLSKIDRFIAKNLPYSWISYLYLFLVECRSTCNKSLSLIFKCIHSFTYLTTCFCYLCSLSYISYTHNWCKITGYFELRVVYGVGTHDHQILGHEFSQRRFKVDQARRGCSLHKWRMVTSPVFFVFL